MPNTPSCHSILTPYQEFFWRHPELVIIVRGFEKAHVLSTTVIICRSDQTETVQWTRERRDLKVS